MTEKDEGRQTARAQETRWKIIKGKRRGDGGRQIPSHHNSSSHIGSYLPIPWRHQLFAALLQRERRRGRRNRFKKRDGDKKCELTHAYALYNAERRACTVGGRRQLGLQGSTVSSHTEIHSRPEAPQQHIRLFLTASKHACYIQDVCC